MDPFTAFMMAIGGGSSILSGLFGAASSREAADAQRRAVNQGIHFQREMGTQAQKNYEAQQANQAPWLQAGQSSLADLMRQMQGGGFDNHAQYQNFDPSQLANDPGYQFRMQEGAKALERSAAAKGGLMSGKFAKGLDRYSQGVASDEFNNAWNRHENQYQNEWARNQSDSTGRFNRLASMAGVGQQAANSLGSFGAQQNAQMGQYGNSIASLYGDMGNVNASGIMGQGNAYSGMAGSLGNMANMYGMYNMMNKIPGQGGR